MVQHDVRSGMSLSDFIAQYSRQPFELHNGGESIDLSPNISGHQWVARTLFRLFEQFFRANPIAEVIWETPFVLTDQADWVKGSRTPDLALYLAHRWAEYVAKVPDWKQKPIIMVPDLVVEVVSPTDHYSDINNKVEGYLSDGVQIVWVIDPQCCKVAIHRADSDQQTTLRESGALTGEDLLPGFSVSVRTLFV